MNNAARADALGHTLERVRDYLESLPYAVTPGDLVAIRSQPGLPNGIVLSRLPSNQYLVRIVRPDTPPDQIVRGLIWHVPYRDLKIVRAQPLPRPDTPLDQPLRVVTWYSLTRELIVSGRFEVKSWANMIVPEGTIYRMLEDRAGNFYQIPVSQ